MERRKDKDLYRWCATQQDTMKRLEKRSKKKIKHVFMYSQRRIIEVDEIKIWSEPFHR